MRSYNQLIGSWEKKGGACCGREILSVSSICKRHQQSSKCIRMRASYNTEDSNDTSE